MSQQESPVTLDRGRGFLLHLWWQCKLGDPRLQSTWGSLYTHTSQERRRHRTLNTGLICKAQVAFLVTITNVNIGGNWGMSH